MLEGFDCLFGASDDEDQMPVGGAASAAATGGGTEGAVVAGSRLARAEGAVAVVIVNDDESSAEEDEPAAKRPRLDSEATSGGGSSSAAPLAPPGVRVARGAEAATADDRDAVIVGGLQCDSLGGWGRIFSFTEPQARTRASVACVAFLGPTNSVPRSATFGRKQLIVDGAPTFDRVVRAHERFPALCVNAINLKGCNEITDDFIVALVEICPEITDLNLESCSPTPPSGRSRGTALCWRV